MVSEFSTFGSCASRNIFNSKINPNYKSYFNINHSIEAIALISLMSKPIVDYNKELIDSHIEYDNKCIREDLSKNFLEFLKNTDVEYLIIDTFFDVGYRLIKISDDMFLSDSERLRRTSLNNQFKNYPRIKITDNFDEYFSYWKTACDNFFKLLNEYNPNLIVILNCAKSTGYCLDKNNNVVKKKVLMKKTGENKYRAILDTYILKNYDVEVMPYDYTTLADENHVFHLHRLHYEPRYYQEKTNQLNEIIKRNNEFEYDSEINKKIRQIRKEKEILNMELDVTKMKYNSKIKKLNKKNKKLNKKNKKLEKKYKSVINSKSWKVTKPLRKLKKILNCRSYL